jgi:hypothetical protein
MSRREAQGQGGQPMDTLGLNSRDADGGGSQSSGFSFLTPNTVGGGEGSDRNGTYLQDLSAMELATLRCKGALKTPTDRIWGLVDPYKKCKSAMYRMDMHLPCYHVIRRTQLIGILLIHLL